MCCGAEAGSYLRLIDSCITQLKVQGPSRTCNERKEEEEGACGEREVFRTRNARGVQILCVAIQKKTQIERYTTLEATQGQILSQSPTHATRFWWHLYGS